MNMMHPIREGTDSPKSDKVLNKLKLTGIFRYSFMFKIRGIFSFLPKSAFDPPYMGSEDFENYYVRVKNQSCRKLYIWVSKPIRRKKQNQRKKLELNRTYQSREKSQKPPE